MAPLTEAEIADYRDLAGGDACPESIISDDRIQGFYDTASGLSTDAETVQALTMVAILRRLLGRASAMTDLGGDFNNEKRSQWFDHIKEVLLPYWEGLAGVGGGGILSAGTIDLNINYTEEDLEAGL